MATFTDAAECPQCGYTEAIRDLQTRTLEDSLFCPRCGYRFWTRIVIDRKLTQDRADGRQYFKLTKAGKWQHRAYTRKGYGAYFVRMPNGFGVLGAITHPDALERMAAQLAGQPDAWLSRWNDETGKVETVLGKVSGCRRRWAQRRSPMRWRWSPMRHVRRPAPF